MKLMILDGNSIVNRAFYGVRPLSTRDGTPTHAVYGFLTILQKLVDETKPDALCVAFDRREPTFRHEAYDGYKAQRKGMPDELAVQMPLLKEVLDAMNIPRYELAGWEADDLIGTIARLDEGRDWETFIVTGDKDSLQLITPKTTVKLVSTRMGQTTTRDMTPEAFRADYGFSPDRMVDLKGLMGDASDNIPGVPGIGEKTAMDLVTRFGTVEEIYAALDTLDVKPGVRKKLDEGRDLARLSKELATIRCDAPIEFSPEGAKRQEVDAAALYALFHKLEFSKLIDRFALKPPTQGAQEEPAFTAECTVTEVQSDEALRAMTAALAAGGPVGVRHNADLSLVTAVCQPNAFLIRAGSPVYEKALRALCAPEVQKTGHGVKDTMRALLERGYETGGWVFDTELAAYLLDPTASAYPLPKLTEAYCGFTIGGHGGEPDGQLSLLGDEVVEQARLLSEGAAVLALHEHFAPKLTELGMDLLYRDMELPLCAVLAGMEHEGFLVDRTALSAFGEMLRGRIAQAQETIYREAGETFNINSTQQLGKILFEKLGLPPVKKTKTGYSTNVEVLEKLQGMHPVIDAIMDYRQLTKLNSTYVEGLSKVIAADGRIHTFFQNTVTATGRLSSTEPNLQNIPVRTAMGAELRKMFVAPPGRVLVDADYSQIELRLLAHISGDAAMIAAFQSGVDIHTVTAGQVFGISPEEVTPEMRRRAKAVNFGIVYGISDFSLAQDIGVFRAEAKEYMQRYFDTYRGVRDYMAAVVEQARRDGFVATLFGRRRWLPELTSSNYNLRSFGERVALNMPIQGTAADIIKLAMVRVDRRLRAEGLSARLVLQVHDELIVECPEAEAETVKALLTQEMERAADLSVALVAEAHAGPSWAAAH